MLFTVIVSAAGKFHTTSFACACVMATPFMSVVNGLSVIALPSILTSTVAPAGTTKLMAVMALMARPELATLAALIKKVSSAVSVAVSVSTVPLTLAVPLIVIDAHPTEVVRKYEYG